MNIKYLFLFIIIHFSIQSVATGIPITYKSYIDNEYGFYRVIDITTHNSSPFDINTRTLTINQGDTIIWENDAKTGIKMTIVSTQKLWEDVYLKNRFDYTFNDPGMYNIYIREYPKVQQKIVVNSTHPDSTDTIATQTPIQTIPTPVQTTINIPREAIRPIQTIPTPIPTTIPDSLPILDENTKRIMLMSVVAIILLISLIYVIK